MRLVDPKKVKSIWIFLLMQIPIVYFNVSFTWNNWIVLNTDPSKVWKEYLFMVNWLVVYPLIMAFGIYYYGIWARMVTKFSVDFSGICAKGLFPGYREYLWSDVIAYSVNAEKADNISILFSKTEIDSSKTKNLFWFINKNRIVIQLYDDMWERLSSYIPEDIKTNIEKCFTCGEIKIYTR